METMSVKTVIGVLDSFTVKTTFDQYPLAKQSKTYQLLKDAIANKKTTIRPAYGRGHGKYHRVQNYSYQICFYLKMLDIPYTMTNDAPRGGQAGTLITLNVLWED